MDIKEFHVGQIAYMESTDIRGGSSHNPDPLREVTVTKIGRKYVTVSWGAWREIQFEPTHTTDRFLTEKTEYGYGHRLYVSKDAYEETMELKQLRIWFRKASSYGNERQYTLDQLRAVKQILDNTAEQRMAE